MGCNLLKRSLELDPLSIQRLDNNLPCDIYFRSAVREGEAKTASHQALRYHGTTMTIIRWFPFRSNCAFSHSARQVQFVPAANGKFCSFDGFDVVRFLG